MIHVIRHADAGKRSAWNGDDTLRPLTEQGRLEAKLIAERLGGGPPVPLLSSAFTRCIQTLAPLAARFGSEIVGDDRLLEGAAPEPLVRLIGELPVGSVLCTHGDVVANLIGHLAATGTALDHRIDTGKGAVWTLDVVAGRVRGGAYTPPPTT